MCPCRYILLGDVECLLNCNLSYVYAITKRGSMYLHRLGYTILSSKELEHSEKKRTKKLSAKMCMSERQCYTYILSKMSSRVIFA